MATQHRGTPIIQNSIPVWYSPQVKVIPCSPDRVPHLSVEILYLIAQALPRPKWIYNLARVNKQSWHYLQPALFQCEVTYDARLKEHFGNGDEGRSGIWSESWSEDGITEKQTADQEEAQDQCRHCLRTTLCEECGDRIAMEKVSFKGDWHSLFQRTRCSTDMTALHWACRKDADGLPAGLKAIRAASVHQPSYIDGMDLMQRRMGTTRPEDRWDGYYGLPIHGEIPPPLLLAVAFGNAELCEALVEAGCNVNLLQHGERCKKRRAEAALPWFQVGTVHDPFYDDPDFQGEYDDSTECQTAGQVAVKFGRPALLKLLLDSGLNPRLGRPSLIHLAVSMVSSSATRILLDRCPELSQVRERHGWTPLHELSHFDWAPTTHPRELLKAIASDLVQNGACLEAELFGDLGSPDGTPLQVALQLADKSLFYEGELLRVAEAFVQLGSVWNQPLTPSLPTPSILDNCIIRATEWIDDDVHWKESYTEQRMDYARVVRAMVDRERGRGAPMAPLMEHVSPPREAFLHGFKELALQGIQGVPLPRRYDAFAAEVVGKLLLSTGITPDAILVSKWVRSVRKIQDQTMQTASGRKRSLWEDVLLGRPASQQESETEEE